MASSAPSASSAIGMKTVQLPGITRPLSRLGFGCSGLMARMDRPASLRLLETAAESGITHFDVARSYGYGEAESVVGDLLRTRRSQLTVATKVGILPPHLTTSLAMAKAAARRLVHWIPGLRGPLRKRAAGLVRHRAFDLATVRGSVETSLRALRVEHIDLLLLHDCQYEDLQPALLDYLECCRQQGKIGQFGLATDTGTIRAAMIDRNAFVSVAQFANAASAPPVGPPLLPHAGAIGLLTHSALGPRFLELTARIGGDPLAAKAWAERFDVDVTDRDRLGRLLLAAALAENPDGVVLFSSARSDRLMANARLLSDEPLSPQDAGIMRQMATVYANSTLGQVAT